MNTHTQANLLAALSLAAAGLRIFPAGITENPNGEGWGKKPLIGGWRSRATTDEAQIGRWWTDYSHAVPGIELGGSGLVALDGDRHGDGPDGVTALNEILGADTARHPLTLTAGGGEHHIFRQPTDGGPLGNGSGTLPKAVDVRGQGGWIVGPGSVRPDGKSWLSDPDAPSLAEAFSSGTIPVIPEHVVRLIRPAPPLVSKFEQPTISERATAQIIAPTGRVLSYGAGLLTGICREIASELAGTRNKKLNACSFKVGRAIASGAVDRGEAERALLRAAVDCGLVADDGEAAARATIQSGLSAGILQPISDLADRLDKDRGQGAPLAARQSVLHWHDTNNVLVMPKWLIKKMLPETGVAIIAGQWSSGKTFVAIHLAECVATGKSFAGRKVKRQGGTLFIAAEAAGDIPVRLRGITTVPLTGEHNRLAFAWVEEVPRISHPAALERLIEIAQEAAIGMKEKFGLPLAMIVIDTMAAAAGFADENDAAQAQAVMNVLQALARATGALVIAVDHFGKTVDSGTRGSSAKEASADAVLSLIASQTKEGVVEYRTLAIRKLRGGSTGDQIGFSLKQVGFGEDEDGDEITTCVVEFIAGAAPARAKPNVWKGAVDLKRALLVALTEVGQEIWPFHNQGPKVRAVPLNAVRAEFIKLYAPKGGDEENKQDAKRQAWKRQLGRACDDGLVGTREIGGQDLMWMIATTVPAPVNIAGPQAATGIVGV